MCWSLCLLVPASYEHNIRSLLEILTTERRLLVHFTLYNIQCNTLYIAVLVHYTLMVNMLGKASQKIQPEFGNSLNVALGEGAVWAS